MIIKCRELVSSKPNATGIHTVVHRKKTGVCHIYFVDSGSCWEGLRLRCITRAMAERESLLSFYRLFTFYFHRLDLSFKNNIKEVSICL